MERDQILNSIQSMSVQADVNAKLQQVGLCVPPTPTDVTQHSNLYVEWDALVRQCGGLGNVPFDKLGDYLDRWAGLSAYARWAEASADIQRTIATEMRDTVKKQLYLLQDGNREMRDASVFVEPIFLHWEGKFLEYTTLYTAMKSLREGYEKRADAISREITRRTADVTDVRRGANRGFSA